MVAGFSEMIPFFIIVYQNFVSESEMQLAEERAEIRRNSTLKSR